VTGALAGAALAAGLSLLGGRRWEQQLPT
jgi:hypothetical protein